MFQYLLALEAQFGPPPKYTAVIEQTIDYYKGVMLHTYVHVIHVYQYINHYIYIYIYIFIVIRTLVDITFIFQHMQQWCMYNLAMHSL